MELASMTCTPDQEGLSPLTRREIADLKSQVPDWGLLEGRLIRRFETANFMDSIELVTEIARIAKEQEHYPDIRITEYRHVDVIWYSYRYGGITQNDLIMAAKVSAFARTRSL